MQDSRFKSVARNLCLRAQTVELFYEREALSCPGTSDVDQAILRQTANKVWGRAAVRLETGDGEKTFGHG
jgi:hypothetical protein